MHVAYSLLICGACCALLASGTGAHGHGKKAAKGAAAAMGAEEGGSANGGAGGLAKKNVFKEEHLAMVPKFSPLDFRDDWCDTLQAVNNGTLLFKRALEGKNVSFILPLTPDNSVVMDYDEQTQMVTGGYGVEVIEELARRAGFHWHASSRVAPYIDRQKGEAPDQWLSWAVDHYDLTGIFYVDQDRLSDGIRFAYPFLDGSAQLIGSLFTQEQPLRQMLTAMFKPFTVSLWISILGFFFFSAATYLYLERGRDDVTQTTVAGGLGQSLWLTVASFTGGGGFAPQTPFGKLFVISWTFLVLLLTTGFTANLASMLIIRNAEASAVVDLKDAIGKKFPICVKPGSVYENILKRNYGGAVIKRVRDTDEKIEMVQTGKCVGVMGAYEWSMKKATKKYNPTCAISSVGSPFSTIDGSFAARTTTNCSAIVIDVIVMHMHELYQESFFTRKKAQYMDQSADKSCDEGLDAAEDESTNLTIKDMAGAYALHIVVSFLCIIGAMLFPGLDKPSQSIEDEIYEEMKTDRSSDEESSLAGKVS